MSVSNKINEDDDKFALMFPIAASIMEGKRDRKGKRDRNTAKQQRARGSTRIHQDHCIERFVHHVEDIVSCHTT